MIHQQSLSNWLLHNLFTRENHGSFLLDLLRSYHVLISLTFSIQYFITMHSNTISKKLVNNNQSDYPNLDYYEYLFNNISHFQMESTVPKITKNFAIIQSAIAIVGFIGNLLVIYIRAGLKSLWNSIKLRVNLVTTKYNSIERRPEVKANFKASL